MTALQKVNLGTAPAGSDGDAVRTAFSKDNANVDVLNSQAALTSATLITTAQALTTAHIGKRVNINLSSAGTINLPAASTCAVDQVIMLRNLGTTVVTLAITAGSGDTVSVSKLNPGETALLDTDGMHTWTVLMRGRTNSDNETVNGNCAVGGSETVAGTLGVTGLTTLAGGASFGSGGQATISTAGAYSGASAAYSGNVSVGGTLAVTGNVVTNLVAPANTIQGLAVRAGSASGNGSFYGVNTSGSVVSVLGVGAAGVPVDSAALFINNSTGKLSLGTNFGVQADCLATGQWFFGTGGAVSTPTGNRVTVHYPGGSTQYGLGFRPDADTTTSVVFYNTTPSQIGSITQGVSSVSFNTASDYRIKYDLAEMPNALERLLALRPLAFEIRPPGVEKGEYSEGFLAHEVQTQYPYAVTGNKDAHHYAPVFREGYDPSNVKPDDVISLSEVIDLQQLDHSKMIPGIVAGMHAYITKADTLIAQLADRITALEGRQ